MDRTKLLGRYITPLRNHHNQSFSAKPQRPQWICTHCLPKLPRPRRNLLLRPPPSLRRAQTNNAADDPSFRSIVDNPAKLVRAGRRHRPLGLLILAAIPVTAFVLGCWQVRRLEWKTALIAKFEDRLARDPLPLPPVVNPDALPDFDHRRVLARGEWRHDAEMLLGPRLHDGQDGFLVITPLDRSAEFPSRGDGDQRNTDVLVCRGWIPKAKAAQSSRPDGLPTGIVRVEGLLRVPAVRNSFTPENDPARGLWHFADVEQMAAHAGAQPVWVEETMRPDLLATWDRSARGVPIGRAPEVTLRNNHAQYIFTWFSLSAATAVMLWMVVRRPGGSTRRGVRQNTSW